MDEEKIKQILDTREWIGFKIGQSDLKTPERAENYFALLAEIGKNPAYAKKFCGRWALAFAPDCGKYLWENPGAVQFVRALGEAFPYLFYLAEKEGETLKLLVMLTCKSDRVEGDNLSLDRDRFNAYLKQQLKGILFMSEKAGLSPENAQAQIQAVYEYFGLSD